MKYLNYLLIWNIFTIIAEILFFVFISKDSMTLVFIWMGGVAIILFLGFFESRNKDIKRKHLLTKGN